jgi:hypothetical protein
LDLDLLVPYHSFRRLPSPHNILASGNCSKHSRQRFHPTGILPATPNLKAQVHAARELKYQFAPSSPETQNLESFAFFEDPPAER